MSDSLLKSLSDDGVLTLTLNRPQARNAIDAELRAALQAAFAEAGGEARVRALVLTGAGGHFCAGGDIASMAGKTPASVWPGCATARSPSPPVPSR